MSEASALHAGNQILRGVPLRAREFIEESTRKSALAREYRGVQIKKFTRSQDDVSLLKGATMSKRTTRSTADALEIIHRRYYAGRPQRLARLHETIVNEDVARKIAQLRMDAGLTQRQMAKLVGTTAS